MSDWDYVELQLLVPFSPHPLIRGDVYSISDRLVPHSQTQVSYSAGAVLLYQDVFRF